MTNPQDELQRVNEQAVPEVTRLRAENAALKQSLRDHFAGLAMQGLVASSYGCNTFSGIALDAYAIADAMLEQRKKPT